MDDARERILARRARFVAAALVAAGLVAIEGEVEGQAPPPPAPSDSETHPVICLSDDYVEPDPDASKPDVGTTRPTPVEPRRGCGCETPGRG